MNEAIDRISFYIYELRGMVYLTVGSDEPILLPKTHHYLIALYAAARLFEQDERASQATVTMNEFEVKLEELRMGVQAGDVVITDPNGNVVEGQVQDDYVRNVYFNDTYKDSDIPDEEV
jgi:hypothetical protein